MGTGGFWIKEWHYSSEEVQKELSKQGEVASKSIPGTITSTSVSTSKASLPEVNEVSLDGEQGIKALGVSWNPQSDTIRFEVKKTRETLHKVNYPVQHLEAVLSVRLSIGSSYKGEDRTPRNLEIEEI